MQRRPESELILLVIGMAVLLSGMAVGADLLSSSYHIRGRILSGQFSREKERCF
jgi:hypothetical protein